MNEALYRVVFNDGSSEIFKQEIAEKKKNVKELIKVCASLCGCTGREVDDLYCDSCSMSWGSCNR